MNVGPAYKHYALFTFLCTRCIFPIEYFSAWSKTVTMIFINYRRQRVRPCDQSCDFPAFYLLAFMLTILQVHVAGQCALYRSEGFARLVVLVLHTIGWKSQPRTVRHFCANGLVRPRFNSWLWSKKKTEAACFFVLCQRIYKQSSQNTLLMKVTSLLVFNSSLAKLVYSSLEATVLTTFDSFFHSCCTSLTAVTAFSLYDSFLMIIVPVYQFTTTTLAFK